MTQENFDRAMDFILKWEGYKSNDAGDSGGRTIFGIASKYHPEEVDQMWNLPKEEALEIAKEIYRKDYWLPMGCGDMESPFDIICFDCSVNMGIGRAKEFLHQTNDWRDFWFLRLMKYISMKQKYSQFIWGWINRITDLYQLCKNV